MSNREDMADFAYQEANPGYRREVVYYPDPEDDPEFTEHMHEEYAAKNKKIREGNANTARNEEIDRLRQLLEENGINPDGE